MALQCNRIKSHVICVKDWSLGNRPNHALHETGLGRNVPSTVINIIADSERICAAEPISSVRGGLVRVIMMTS